MRKLPLEGVRVVDLTLVWAGPHCTQLLAEWGAEVIRVEPIHTMQPNTRGNEARPSREFIQSLKGSGQWGYAYPDREPGERPWNRIPAFNSHARNKLSMSGNIMATEGHDVLKHLVAISDVLVENNVPETIEKAHCTYEELVKVNPSLVMLRMPAYGLSGPYKNYRSFGTHMEATVGHHYLRGYTDSDPSQTGEAFTADAAAGVMGAYAIMMALRHRRRTGQGQQIEMAQAENFLPYLGEFILDYTMNGRVAGPQGNTHPFHAPHNVYPCEGEDRWVTIDVGTQEEWRAFCGALGDPEWTRLPQFQDPVSRKANEGELDQHIAQWTQDKDPYEVFWALQNAGVAAGPVQNERDAYNCPQLQDRGFFEEITHPEAGTHSYPGLNFRMDRTPNHIRRYPPRLGEDNDYLYREVLGISDEEYGKLESLGHIGMDYLPNVQ